MHKYTLAVTDGEKHDQIAMLVNGSRQDDKILANLEDFIAKISDFKRTFLNQ